MLLSFWIHSVPSYIKGTVFNTICVFLRMYVFTYSLSVIPLVFINNCTEFKAKNLPPPPKKMVSVHKSNWKQIYSQMSSWSVQTIQQLFKQYIIPDRINICTIRCSYLQVNFEVFTEKVKTAARIAAFCHLLVTVVFCCSYP